VVCSFELLEVSLSVKSLLQLVLPLLFSIVWHFGVHNQLRND